MALTQTGNYREEIDKLLGQYVDAIKRQTANNLNSEAVTAEGVTGQNQDVTNRFDGVVIQELCVLSKFEV